VKKLAHVFGPQLVGLIFLQEFPSEREALGEREAESEAEAEPEKVSNGEAKAREGAQNKSQKEGQNESQEEPKGRSLVQFFGRHFNERLKNCQLAKRESTRSSQERRFARVCVLHNRANEQQASREQRRESGKNQATSLRAGEPKTPKGA